MRVLVTGGAGFIGSHLVRHLLADGLGASDVSVVNLDALTYAGHRSNLECVEDHQRHRLVEGDICDGPLVRELMEGVDVVFHLAAESHVDRSIVDDQPFVRTNVLGTATLLSAALDAGVQRFVQVSTDEVYGELPWVDPDGGVTGPRFTEDTALRPRSPYAATKAAADHLVMSYHATHGLDVVITRSSNNYGPRQYPEKLIPVILDRAMADDTVPVYGDGLHVRDWMHVDDHCTGLIAAAARGRAGRVYNLGAATERTNLSVVREVLRFLEKPESLIRFVEDRPGHDRRYAVDFTRASQELSWEPSVGFEGGLSETVQWYRAHPDWVAAVLGT